MLRHSAGEKDYSISWKDLCRIETLARPERFELPAYCSGGNRSIQLSYGRAGQNYTRGSLRYGTGERRIVKSKSTCHFAQTASSSLIDVNSVIQQIPARKDSALAIAT